MKKFLIIIILIISIVILLIAYFGFIPGLSSIMGTNKPQNLNVSYTQQTLETASQKTKVEIIESSKQTSNEINYIGKHAVEINLSSNEITALANNSPWKNNPLSQVQIKINQDGTAEASGYIDFETAKSYALSFGVSTNDINSVLNKFPIPQSKFPFYLKASGNVSHDKINLNLSSAKLANIPVPANIIDQYLDPAINFIEDKYLSSESINIETLENKSGEIYLKGDLPDQELITN